MIKEKMNIALDGDSFADELHNSVGSLAFKINHDYFTKEDMVIRTASGGGGTLLVEGSDYIFVNENSDLSARCTDAYLDTRTVYNNMQVINASYQSCDLYFSGDYIADDVDSHDVNRNRSIISASTNFTILDDDLNPLVLLTTGASDKTITLPTLADNQGKIITLKKVDTGAGKAILDGEGAETIEGLDTIELLAGNDTTEVIGTATEWKVLSGICDNWHYVGDTGEPAFENSWVNYDTVTYIKARFRKDFEGFVHADFMVKSGTAETMCTLPTNYRPIKGINCSGIKSGDLGVRVHVAATGAIRLYSYSTTWTAGNIVFKAEQ